MAGCSRCGAARDKPGWCSPCIKAYKRAKDAAAREVLGNRCARCHIDHPLVWDHIENNGAERNPAGGKRKRRSATHFEQAEFTSIIQTGRSDRLQLLCPNCNHLKQFDRPTYDRPATYGPMGEVAYGTAA